MMDKNLIDFVLQYRKAIQAAVDEERENKDTQSVGGNGSGHCRISDPTAQKAIRHIDPVGIVKVFYGAYINGVRDYMLIPEPEKWLSVANATWQYYGHGKYADFMKYRYIDGMSIQGIRDNMKMGKRRYFYIQKDVRRFAYETAKGMNIASADCRVHYERTDEILNALGKGVEKDGCSSDC